MTVRYVPNLRWKRGEKNALSDLSADGRVNVLPLFLLGADQFKPKKATKHKVEVPASTLFAQEVAHCWGPSPFYLDASPITDAPGNPHRIKDIAARCREAGLKLIPVLRTDSTLAYLNTVKDLVANDDRGICLRITLQEMSEIPNWISSWPFPLNKTDLVIDYLNQAESVLAFGQSILGSAFEALHQGSNWRSVTIVGTSIPDNFMGLAPGLYKIPRREKIIWKQLTTTGLPYQLDYGDYATVSIAAPAPGIAWGYPITVKYTLPDDFLVCRGVRTTGLGAEELTPQLLKHAKSITAEPTRNILAHCWADKEINNIATEFTPPKGLEHWARIGVNRHIELIRSTLP